MKKGFWRRLGSFDVLAGHQTGPKGFVAQILSGAVTVFAEHDLCGDAVDIALLEFFARKISGRIGNDAHRYSPFMAGKAGCASVRSDGCIGGDVLSFKDFH